MSEKLTRKYSEIVGTTFVGGEWQDHDLLSVIGDLESELAQAQADVEALRTAIADLGEEWDKSSIHQEIHTTSLGWFIRLCREVSLSRALERNKQMNEKLSLHDHGNCELCDQLESELALLRRAVKELDHDLHRKCKVIAILQNGGQVGPAAGAPHLPLDVLEFIKEQEGASLAEDR